jgi:hypothetical protein
VPHRQGDILLRVLPGKEGSPAIGALAAPFPCTTRTDAREHRPAAPATASGSCARKSRVNREDEIDVAVHPGEIAVDHLPGDVLAAREHDPAPTSRDCILMKKPGRFGSTPLGCACNRRDDATRRALHQIPDEWIADAETHHEKPVDPQMIQQPELVIGVPRPRVDRNREVRWTVRRSRCAGPC